MHQLTVTESNAKVEIERRIGDLVDLLAVFLDAGIDERAWRQLLIYAPHDLVAERHAVIHTKAPSTIDELERILNSEDQRSVHINPDGSITMGEPTP